MLGYDNAEFKPDDQIKIEEAATVMVKVLGYTNWAEYGGGWVDGYYTLALSKNLLNGIGTVRGEATTFVDAAVLIQNVLECDEFVVLDGYEMGMPVETTHTGTDYMSYTLDIYSYTAVVEGVGEHGCEYMTGGRVVVLGPVGKNFAAGMSGGIAYVLDEAGELYRCLNKGLVGMEAVTSRYDRAELRALIEAHVQATGSPKGRRVLENFDELLPKFKKIIPTDYKRLMQLASQFEEQGVPAEQAQVEAFYASLARKA